MKYIVANSEWNELAGPLLLCKSTTEWELSPGDLPETVGEEAVAVFLDLAGNNGCCLLVARASVGLAVNKVTVRGGLQELRDGDRIEVEGAVFTVSITHAASTGVWEQESVLPRCPVCRTALEKGDAVVWCSKCKTPHHRPCFKARSNRCGVYGCLAVSPIEPDAGERDHD